MTFSIAYCWYSYGCHKKQWLNGTFLTHSSLSNKDNGDIKPQLLTTADPFYSRMSIYSMSVILAKEPLTSSLDRSRSKIKKKNKKKFDANLNNKGNFPITKIQTAPKCQHFRKHNFKNLNNYSKYTQNSAQCIKLWRQIQQPAYNVRTQCQS